MNPKVITTAAGIETLFQQAGAATVQAAILQPAETLLDLYGEDIRARAYVTSDPLRGEQMLRPDFTVPVVQMHMEQGAEPARYTYNGVVFRRQEDDATRANEYLQVGYEVFDRSNPAETDAEVFALIQNALVDAPVRATVGDIGILMAAVDGLNTSERRKSALRRHIWRPTRFRALLDRFAGRVETPAARQALIASDDPMAQAGPQIGLRSAAEVAERIDVLKSDASLPPISAVEVDLIEAILQVRETCPNALAQLRDIAVDVPSITGAVTRLGERFEALDARGVETSTLMFETSYGRTSMEYYDGFVFGFHATDHAGLSPIASGGRYDALTQRLGKGDAIPAVGGVIRPDLLIQLAGGAS
ncbi:ATP phosphoribosyltransferase involved in histidine biosynthesis [Rhodobacteraceae bacterium HIMB11]|nr:ATP phosphoribosyltransferase involved in histidine biosynthesis [Rhodobacteraceae bacterium HIMB11]